MIDFLVYLFTIAGIWGLLALSLNLQFGITGLINLGQIAFFMLGAYASTIVTHPDLLGLPIPLGLLAGMLAAGVFAFLISLPTARLREDYWAIWTLAAAEILRLVFLNQTLGSPYMGASFGVSGIPRPLREMFSTVGYGYFYLALVAVVLVIVWLLVHRITEMPYGRALRAMREGDETPLALGKNVGSLRIRAMFIGGLIAGLAGGLYAHFNAFVAPNYFMPIETFLVWVMVIVGGAGNYLGVLAGTVVIQLIYNSTRFIGDYLPIDSSVLASLRMIAIGVLIILVLIYMPQGLFPERRRRYENRRDS